MKQKKIAGSVEKNAVNSFSVKAQGDKPIIVEGLANRAVIDRGNELIPGNAWDLDNFKKNPVLLFQHGRDMRIGSMPIGKVTGIKTNEDGLTIRGEIMESENEDFKFLAKLIKSGILKTFSVGFNPIEMDTREDDGVTVISKAELLEVSVVNIPMNQDSTFTIAAKDYRSNKGKEKIKDYISTIAAKGAWFATGVHSKIYDLQTNESDFDRDEALAAVSAMAEVDEDTIKDILAGNVTPVPEKILEAFSEVLGMDKEILEKLNEGDVERLKVEEKNDEGEEKTEDPEAKEDSEPEEKPEEEKEEETSPEEGEEAKALTLGDFVKARSATVGVSNDDLAKCMGVSLSAVSQLIRGKIRKPKEKRLEALSVVLKTDIERLKSFIKCEEQQVEEPEGEKLEGDAFQDCVKKKIPVLMSEGKERDEAVAQAVALCKEKSKCSLTPEALAFAFDFADNYNAEGEKQEEPSVSVNQQNDDSDFGSPQMDQAKQANVFLGQLIAEQQKTNLLLNELINEVRSKPSKPEDDMEELNTSGQTNKETDTTINNPDDDNSEAEKRTLDIVKKHQDDIGRRLAKYINTNN